jgi:predicted ATP-binding protein involved in virulence
MRLSHIGIKKLFGQFDYSIELNQEEGITILTGPNGYGKTTILNIIYELFGRGGTSNNLASAIEVTLSDGRTLKFPENREEFVKVISVYFIKDQRLQKTVLEMQKGSRYWPIIHEAIMLLAHDLSDSILKKKDEEQQLANKLASSQHNRIKALSDSLDEGEFRARFNLLRERYRQLQNMGIYAENLEDTDYKDNRGYLSIFIEDWEKRLAVYDDLMAKIGMFLSILNEKKLVNKTVAVNAEKGFLFSTSKGKSLPLTALSSGEQNEIILLYELLFNVPPDSLVLIDEPETSMHVAWQIEFIQDLKNIIKIKPLSFIIATHSPDLINDKMDLCVDLFENARGNGNHGE